MHFLLQNQPIFQMRFSKNEAIWWLSTTSEEEEGASALRVAEHLRLRGPSHIPQVSL